MAEREGWELVGEYSDERFSAYKGNRGPDLARARQAAAERASAVLLVQSASQTATTRRASSAV
jgi:Resolvase, N terminal domain